MNSSAIEPYVAEPRVARANPELFCTPTGIPHITFKTGAHYETYELYSPKVRLMLRRRARQTSEHIEKGKSVAAIVTAMLEGLEELAQGNVLEVFHRVGEFAGNIFLDLGDYEWRVVEIRPGYWRVLPSESNPGIRFVREPKTDALPEPTRGGDLENIFKIAHITSPDLRALYLSWIVSTLMPYGTYPILMLTGPEGSAKTTAAAIAARLIDPKVLGKGSKRALGKQLSAPYSSEENLDIAATHRHIVGIDNVTRISDRMSDACCRLVGGTTFETRRLRTNAEIFSAEVKNPIVFAAIPSPTDRPDFLDRTIRIPFEVIESSPRRERVIIEEFEMLWPSLLGAVLDATATALAKLNRDGVWQSRLPDMEAWVDASGIFARGEISRILGESRQASSRETLEGFPIFHPFIALVKENGGTLDLSMRELLRTLKAKREGWESLSGWPTGERSLRRQLDLMHASLRKSEDIAVSYSRDSRTRRSMVHIARITNKVVGIGTAKSKGASA